MPTFYDSIKTKEFCIRIDDICQDQDATPIYAVVLHSSGNNSVIFPRDIMEKSEKIGFQWFIDDLRNTLNALESGELKIECENKKSN